MADIVSPDVRSRMMAGIRGKNTKPEMFVRRELHRRGFRYRIHDTKLPGKPDLVLSKFRAVIFVHGCFWHGHNCPNFKWPKSNSEFWHQKIQRNIRKDEINFCGLRNAGWRIATVWECALGKQEGTSEKDVITRLANWLKSEDNAISIARE